MDQTIDDFKKMEIEVKHDLYTLSEQVQEKDKIIKVLEKEKEKLIKKTKDQQKQEK